MKNIVRGLRGLCVGVYVAEVRGLTIMPAVDDFVVLRKSARFCTPFWQRDRSRADGAGDRLRTLRKGRLADGRMINNQMRLHHPTSVDVPPIRYFFEAWQRPRARTVPGSENSQDGPAPAIVNAVEERPGVRFHSIPLLPEDLFELSVRPLEQMAPFLTEGRHDFPHRDEHEVRVSFTVNGRAKKLPPHPWKVVGRAAEQLKLMARKRTPAKRECPRGRVAAR